MSGLSAVIKLSNGLSMPQIHLGLYLISGRETTDAVAAALEAGYRGFDSAQMYHNERETGQSIRSFLASPRNQSNLKREDIWYTTKLASNTSYDAARKSITQSVQASGLGYIDLFLLHSPYGGKIKRLESWRAVEDAIADGEVRTGGVSNFGVKHVRCTLATHRLSLLIPKCDSYKNCSTRSPGSVPPSTRSKCTRSTRARRSRISARPTTLWWRRTPRWRAPFG